MILPGRPFARWKEADGKLTVDPFQGVLLKLSRDGEDLKDDLI
jgi:hypothetical protein